MTKICTKCKEEKNLDDFRKSKRGLYGKRPECKICEKQYHLNYIRERSKKDEAFREKRKEQSSKWSKLNPEKRAKIARQRNLRAKSKHPEKIKARALVNQKIRFGRMPKASDCKCIHCGEQAKHYHHYLGYDFVHRYDVQPLCIKCHNNADS